jgi:phosphoglycerate-specific signal transduction histidine kinase
MALTPNSNLSDKQVEQRLRKAADLIAEADALIQSTFEADDELYILCSQLQDYCADFEMEADELASLAK